MRETGFDVLAHLDGPLVQERFPVVEEVDADEPGTGFVHDIPEELEVEHPRVARLGNAGLRGAARLRTRNVAGRGALDVETGRQPADIQGSYRRLLTPQGQLERAVTAELRTAGVEIG